MLWLAKPYWYTLLPTAKKNYHFFQISLRRYLISRRCSMQWQFEGNYILKVASIPWTWLVPTTCPCAEDYYTEKHKHRLNTDRDRLLLTTACLYFEFFIILRITCGRTGTYRHNEYFELYRPFTVWHHLEGGTYWNSSTEMWGVISRTVVIWGAVRCQGNVDYFLHRISM